MARREAGAFCFLRFLNIKREKGGGPCDRCTQEIDATVREVLDIVNQNIHGGGSPAPPASSGSARDAPSQTGSLRALGAPAHPIAPGSAAARGAGVEDGSAAAADAGEGGGASAAAFSEASGSDLAAGRGAKEVALGSFHAFLRSFVHSPKAFAIYANATVSTPREWEEKLGGEVFAKQNAALTRDLGEGISLGSPGGLPRGEIVGVVWISGRGIVTKELSDYHLPGLDKWPTGLSICAAVCFEPPVSFSPAAEGWKPGRLGRVDVTRPWFYVKAASNLTSLLSARGVLKYGYGLNSSTVPPTGQPTECPVAVFSKDLGMSYSQMPALCVTQPYATALAKFYKRIEYRPRNFPRCLMPVTEQLQEGAVGEDEGEDIE